MEPLEHGRGLQLSLLAWFKLFCYFFLFPSMKSQLDSSWNVMARGDAREGKWRGNWRMEWEVSTLHTTSEHCVSSITTADAHTSAASSRLNWRPRRFKWTRPFRRKTKSGFCACVITFTFQTHSTSESFRGCPWQSWTTADRPTHRSYMRPPKSIPAPVLHLALVLKGHL